MPRLTPWSWWVASESSLADDRIYDLDDCPTREAAIATGLRETRVGDRFHIVEARCWDGNRESVDDFDPFARERNHETFTVTAPGEYVAVPAPGEARARAA